MCVCVCGGGGGGGALSRACFQWQWLHGAGEPLPLDHVVQLDATSALFLLRKHTLLY